MGEPAPPATGAGRQPRAAVGPLCLYLFRHGAAGLPSAWNGDDATRPLTTKGRKQVRRVAKALARMDIDPDLVLTSPYTRARQTAAIARKVLGIETQPIAEAGLQPGATRETLTAILLAHVDARSVMVVGHEPDLSSWIAEYCGGGRVQLDKAGIAELHLDRSDMCTGVLVWLAQPGHLER